MDKLKRRLKLPAILMTGSFLVLALLALLTSPVKNISFAAAFFLMLTVFLVSTGYLVVRLQSGVVRPKARYRIFIVSSFLLVLLMFRSAQSLGWVDLVTLVLIAAGLTLYADRRIE